jgi:hypothetical protein
MAIALTEKRQSHSPVDIKIFRGNLGVYATGGVAIAPSDVGFRAILAVVVVGGNDLTRRYAYDPANNKVMCITTSTGAELANSTDITAITLDFIVFGY